MSRKNIFHSIAASTNKNKEKHMARKQEKRRIKDETNNVTAAKKLVDLAPLCQDLLRYENKGLEVNLYLKNISELDKMVYDWALDLTERNMKKLYETCPLGWNKELKMEEMSDSVTRFLIAEDKSGKLLAFSHFRFDMDFGTSVLYCYELQIESEGRRQGLGQRLLNILERLASSTHMSCVRLTALKNNPGAAEFFRACGYKLDETSPEPDEHAPYEILSKQTKQEST